MRRCGLTTCRLSGTSISERGRRRMRATVVCLRCDGAWTWAGRQSGCQHVRDLAGVKSHVLVFHTRLPRAIGAHQASARRRLGRAAASCPDIAIDPTRLAPAVLVGRALVPAWRSRSGLALSCSALTHATFDSPPARTRAGAPESRSVARMEIERDGLRSWACRTVSSNARNLAATGMIAHALRTRARSSSRGRLSVSSGGRCSASYESPCLRQCGRELSERPRRGHAPALTRCRSPDLNRLRKLARRVQCAVTSARARSDALPASCLGSRTSAAAWDATRLQLLPRPVSTRPALTTRKQRRDRHQASSSKHHWRFRFGFPPSHTSGGVARCDPGVHPWQPSSPPRSSRLAALGKRVAQHGLDAASAPLADRRAEMATGGQRQRDRLGFLTQTCEGQR